MASKSMTIRKYAVNTDINVGTMHVPAGDVHTSIIPARFIYRAQKLTLAAQSVYCIVDFPVLVIGPSSVADPTSCIMARPTLRAPSPILVIPRAIGNPILKGWKAVVWYGDDKALTDDHRRLLRELHTTDDEIQLIATALNSISDRFSSDLTPFVESHVPLPVDHPILSPVSHGAAQ
jgi:hypothetical protein